MAKRLIDADALPVTTLTDGGYWTKDVVYKRDIDEAPTVEAVEVVRCKDCKHYVFPEDGDFLGECKNGRLAVSQSGEIYPEENYYCSYGERRTDGTA